mmetsp:Transcript_27607/g.78080  ORF Transcript_27607/g.78080 Transcript_27607/m.78080 type:complete len:307 (-) Transcript_27607:238-1158(-)
MALKLLRACTDPFLPMEVWPLLISSSRARCPWCKLLLWLVPSREPGPLVSMKGPLCLEPLKRASPPRMESSEWIWMTLWRPKSTSLAERVPSPLSLVQLLSRLHLHLLQDQVLHVLPLAALLGHEQVLQNLPVCCSSFDGPCPEIGCDGGVVELFQRPHLVDKVLDVLGVCDEVLVEQLQRQCLFFFRFSVQVLIFVYPPKLPSSQVAYERQSILRQTVVREICEEVLLHRREDVDAVAIFAALLGVAGRRFRAQRNRGSNHGPVLLTRNHGQFAGPLPVPFPPIGGRRRRGLNEGKGRYSKARGR